MTIKALIPGSAWLVLLFLVTGSREATSQPPATTPGKHTLVQIISAVSSQMDSARFDSAQLTLNKGFRILQRQPDPEMEFYLLAYQSEVFYYNAMVEQGIQFALKGLNVAGQLNDSTMMANQHNLLGLLYSDLDQLTKAIQHLKRGLTLLPGHPESRFELTERYQILSNLGQCYDQIGQYDLAIKVNRESYRHAVLKKSKRGSAIAAWALGNDYAALTDEKEAMGWYTTGLAEALSGREYDVVIMIYLARCNLLLKKKPEQAVLELVKGIRLMDAKRSQISTYSRRAFAKEQTGIYYQLKNYKRAVDTHRLLKQIDDEIQEAEKKQRLAMLQAYYDNENRILRYQERERFHRKEIAYNQQLALATAIFAGLLLVSLLAVMYGYRQKQKVKDLMQQQKIQALTREHEVANLKAMIIGEEQERLR
ncbi:tetratricopeptide repeat protein, partial [Arsenicibacter rosenii]|uniref:tetratricopeptide repeat protein n=1 Tax=Arsenicibacter rosenii TaxID=1750698 RepID=UPI00116034AD